MSVCVCQVESCAVSRAMLDDISAQDVACKAIVERAQDKLQRLNLDAEVAKHQAALDDLQRKASALRQVHCSFHLRCMWLCNCMGVSLQCAVKQTGYCLPTCRQVYSKGCIAVYLVLLKRTYRPHICGVSGFVQHTGNMNQREHCKLCTTSGMMHSMTSSPVSHSCSSMGGCHCRSAIS